MNEDVGMTRRLIHVHTIRITIKLSMFMETWLRSGVGEKRDKREKGQKEEV
jgi:hypothetical protein